MIIQSRLFFKILTNNFAKAMALYPIILVIEKYMKTDLFIINHERIHLKQQLELLIVLFYVWYLTEFLIRFFQMGSFSKAYRKISFEQEAFENDNNMNYLKNRRCWAFLAYL